MPHTDTYLRDSAAPPRRPVSPRGDFGPRLRAQRERRGISLESISESTKIKVSLLAELERNDLSKWPRGLFRRAYIREYATTVGLDPRPVVDEFVHLFPEDGEPATDQPVAGAPVQGTPPLRLTLDVEPLSRGSVALARLAAAALEAGVIVAIGGLLALITGGSILGTAGMLALFYYPFAAVCTGRSLHLRRLPTTMRQLAHALAEALHAARRRRMHLVRTHHPAPDAQDVPKEQDSDDLALVKRALLP